MFFNPDNRLDFFVEFCINNLIGRTIVVGGANKNERMLHLHTLGHSTWNGHLLLPNGYKQKI